MSDLKKPSNCVGKPERHPGGAPRIHDRMKIVQDFVEFARNNPTCLTVPMFTSTIGISSALMRKWASECSQFSATFDLGKEIIGINRLNATNEKLLERSIYSQVIGNYDLDVNIYQREEKRFESELRKKEESSKQTTFNIVVPHDLAIGANISTEDVSKEHSPSAE